MLTIDSSCCNLASEETSCRSVVQMSVLAGASSTFVTGAAFGSAIFGTTIEVERDLNVVPEFGLLAISL